MPDKLTDEEKSLIAAAVAKGLVEKCPPSTHSPHTEALWDPAAKRLRPRVVYEKEREKKKRLGRRTACPDASYALFKQGKSAIEIARLLQSSRTSVLEALCQRIK